MQRTIGAILMSIGMVIAIIVLVREIVIGNANNYRFYLLFISFAGLFGVGWYNYYKNRPQKENKIAE